MRPIKAMTTVSSKWCSTTGTSNRPSSFWRPPVQSSSSCFTNPKVDHIRVSSGKMLFYNSGLQLRSQENFPRNQARNQRRIGQKILPEEALNFTWDQTTTREKPRCEFCIILPVFGTFVTYGHLLSLFHHYFVRRNIQPAAQRTPVRSCKRCVPSFVRRRSNFIRCF